MNLTQLTWRALSADRPYIKGLISDLAGMSQLHAALFIAEARAEKKRLTRKLLLLAAAIAAFTIAVIFFLIA